MEKHNPEKDFRLTPEQLANQEKMAGKVFLKENKIHFAANGEEQALFEVEEIKLIAELTTADGPYAVDYFILFVLGEESYFELPFCAVGMVELLETIFEDFDEKLHLKLMGSTNLDTSIIYPLELRYDKFYSFELPKGFWYKILGFLGLAPLQGHLTEEVTEYLRRTSNHTL